jgi:hypothetical protein
MDISDSDINQWLKPRLLGAFAGAGALAFLGFNWGGWMTGDTAEKMAAYQAQSEVVAALVPICLEQSKQDPNAKVALTLFKDAYFNERRDIVISAGWATMPGSDSPIRGVATACMDKIATQL